MNKELIKGLTKEQIEKVKACKNNEDLLALAKAEGVELTDEQLAAISGGACISFSSIHCPKCGSTKHKQVTYHQLLNECSYFVCEDCGAEWE